MDRMKLAERLYKGHKHFINFFVRNHLLTSSLAHLPMQEVTILEYLSLNPWVSMSDLASTLNTAANTTTGIVDRMVKRGYIQRRQSEKDRRVVEVALANKGLRMYDVFIKLQIEYSFNLLDALTDDEASNYLSMIDKMVAKLESEINK